MDAEDERERYDLAYGIFANNRNPHRSTYERGMLDLRLQLIKMRTDYLNQINTQATLIAGCAVAMLASGELINLDDLGHDAVAAGQHFAWAWIRKKACDLVYSGSAAICLGSSLWVLYTAMNLINMSIHSTIYGESTATIGEADNLIDAVRQLTVALTRHPNDPYLVFLCRVRRSQPRQRAVRSVSRVPALTASLASALTMTSTPTPP